MCLVHLKTLWHCRANGAEDASPGQRPGYRARNFIVRPVRAEGKSCAPSGRTTIKRYQNPGRCPGLAIRWRFQRHYCFGRIPPRSGKLTQKTGCGIQIQDLASGQTMTKLWKYALAMALLILPGKLLPAQSPDQASVKKKAIADLKEIAYAGNVNAQVQLGVIYLTGDGVARDDAEALKWLRKAADQDNALAERYLAEMYFKGRGVPADVAEAARWLRLAAEQGDAESEHNLAVLYTQGLGVPRNMKEAASWMRKSAEQNLAAGEQGLGTFYENGDGMPPDPFEAASWYRKAVDQNYVPAMNSLALLLATTRESGVRNPKQAIDLATKAVAAGTNPDYLDTLAAAYFADGQNDKAVETEEKALARNPENDSYKKAMQKYLAAAHGSR
jgi:TPR repeat protein